MLDNSSEENLNTINQEFHSELLCSKCNKPFKTERAFKIGNSYFHLHHLHCVVCTRKITEEFIYYGNYFWCKRCSKSAIRTCNHCDKKIESNSCIFADHKFYHDGHFLCSICQRKIMNTKDQSKQFGKIPYDNSFIYVCYECLQRVSKNTCSRCSTLIQNDEKYIKSRNGIWHTGCFICSVCNTSLLSKDQFCEYNGLLYCILHNPKNNEIAKNENSHKYIDSDNNNFSEDENNVNSNKDTGLNNVNVDVNENENDNENDNENENENENNNNNNTDNINELMDE